MFCRSLIVTFCLYWFFELYSVILFLLCLFAFGFFGLLSFLFCLLCLISLYYYDVLLECYNS
ncbi:hypothetical protein B6N65_29060 [Bacillus sp. KbaB1]|nr:hypothetical protein GBN96_28675 [Bacillus sp. B4-WWTP-NA-D-NA-NA]OXL91155.1 hypothetical protein B6N65_29060 [Bacillus sp. KbaB1]